MLVLTRQLDEEIRIAEDIVIKVVSIDRGKVRLGITAPVDVPIWREELLPEAERYPVGVS